jgi:hypothetical protein
VHWNSSIRSSYIFNPRMRKASSSSDIEIARKYPRTTDVKSVDVLGMDSLACPGANGNSPEGAPFTPDNWAHWPGQGLNTLFTDGSARFGVITDATLFKNIVSKLVSDESGVAHVRYNLLFSALQNAP